MDTCTHICLSGMFNGQHIGRVPASIVSSDCAVLWEIKTGNTLMGDDEDAYRLL